MNMNAAYLDKRTDNRGRASFSTVLLLPILGFTASLLTTAPLAHAVVGTASLSNTTIPFETVGTPIDVTINYTITGGPDAVTIEIFHLRDVQDQPGPENVVASIQQSNVPAGAHTYLWNALWPIGGDLGRSGGLYQFIITAGGSSFTIGTLLEITSVDIHSVSVTPSLDANQNPAFPYIITYALAKDSLVTAQVKNPSGDPIRTLLSNSAQYGELIKINRLIWDGLDDNGRPVPLGVYTVTLVAKDPAPGSSDFSYPRSRSISVLSLSNVNSNPQQIFDTNTFVFPNPVRNGQATLQTLAVRNNANISFKIYTLTGDLVREASFSNQAIANVVSFNWDGANQAGKKVGRGLYYVVVREEDPEGTLQTTKKMAVIQ